MAARATKKKKRLDSVLVERGLADNQANAARLVMSGKVVVGDHRVDKPGTPVSVDAAIHVKGGARGGWASRGAYKLLSALDAFPELASAVNGARCLDIGASTGGFTDVLLKHGAAHVTALDVGYGQLVWRLQTDPRVTVLDRTNIRLLDIEALPHRPSIATCDASFIGIASFVGVVARALEPDGWFVALVKPQFEAARADVGEGGVVVDEAVRQQTLVDAKQAARAVGFRVVGAVDSALAGPQGNREFLLVLRLGEAPTSTPSRER